MEVLAGRDVRGRRRRADVTRARPRAPHADAGVRGGRRPLRRDPRRPRRRRSRCRPGTAGAAISRKLLRSVFYKGLAAAVVEALAAAEAAGCADWLRDNISAELAGFDEQTIDRLVDGTPGTPGAAPTRWPPPPSS